jgi:type I restriction enzyme, S subunit
MSEGLILDKYVRIRTAQINPGDFPNEVFDHFSIPNLDVCGSSQPELGSTVESGKFLLGGPAVLVSKLNPRKMRVFSFPGSESRRAIASTEFMVFEARDEGVIDLGFLTHVLNGEVFAQKLQAVATGTTNSHVRVRPTETLRWPVLVPTIEEQRRIGEILDTIDETIQATERVIAKLAIVRTGLIDGFLCDPKTPSVPLGRLLERIDGGWSPLCTETPPRGDQWGVLKVSSVTREIFKPQNSKTLPSEFPPRLDLVVRPGDVIAARANGVAELVARTAYVESCDGLNLLLSDKTLRLVPKPQTLGRYLAYCMQHEIVRRQVRGLVSGSTGQGNITQAEIRSIAIPFPEISEQERIVEVIASHDELANAEQRSNEQLRLVRSGLAADLLSGRVRTVAS